MVDVVPPTGAGAGPGLTVAMHMSDGLVNAPTAAVFGLVAVLGLAIAASRARADLDERTAPMAGLVTAFVFAVQMINFPILPGASGHLLGGALVAILVGPWVGSLCIAIVLVVQALLFADGGLTALGTVLGLMVGLHVLVGIGEGIITAATVAAVAATRPDLVYLLRGHRPAVGHGLANEGVAR